MLGEKVWRIALRYRLSIPRYVKRINRLLRLPSIARNKGTTYNFVPETSSRWAVAFAQAPGLAVLTSGVPRGYLGYLV